jgi:exodeoxyribonuclease-3
VTAPSASRVGGALRLATWNVNSLRARSGRVAAWLAEVRPDVCCLQETKLADEAVPVGLFRDLGYELAHVGEGRWNGVAIASRVGLDDVEAELPGAPVIAGPGRYLAATCGGVRVVSVYVPNGRSLDNEQYRAKLAWLDALADEVATALAAGRGGGLAICGDFNVAPDDRDVYDPADFAGATHVSEPERAALGRLLSLGLVDGLRRMVPDAGIYTWWDYRGGSFHRNRGMRIDLVLLDRELADRLCWVLVDRNARRGPEPSDHAPVVCEFAPRE